MSHSSCPVARRRTLSATPYPCSRCKVLYTGKSTIFSVFSYSTTRVGNQTVAKIVLTAAAQHLTPVTLEVSSHHLVLPIKLTLPTAWWYVLLAVTTRSWLGAEGPSQGKNAAVFDPRVSNLKVAAKRLMWGKLTNAGQACSSSYIYIYTHLNAYNPVDLYVP